MNWKRLLSSVFIVLQSVAITGCGLFSPKVITERHNNYIAIICPDPIKPRPIVTAVIEPRAVIDQTGMAWVGLTPQHYGHLAVNTQETIRYIKDQHGVVKYYRTCITDFNESIEKLKDEEESANATE